MSDSIVTLKNEQRITRIQDTYLWAHKSKKEKIGSRDRARGENGSKYETENRERRKENVKSRSNRRDVTQNDER